MKTIQLILAISLLSIFSQSCRKGGPWGIKGKGPNVTETKELEGFDKIHLSMDADIYYTQDSVYKVEISAQQNILAVLKTEVKNHALQFDFRRNVWGHSKIKITVHTPDLNDISISGSGDITAQNTLNTNALELSISGSGNINLPSVNAKNLKVTISGSGDVKISGGSLISETFKISGSGDIDAEGIMAENSTITISGSGDAKVYVTESLDVRISGSGDVHYKGNPSIDSDISGSGKLTRLD